MDTIVAPITPLIISSIIVIRISGPDALMALKFIRGKRKLLPNRIYYGDFIDKDNDVYDSVLYYYFKAPKSYTGEEVLEISFHGNPIIVQKAISSLNKIGFRLAEAGEFTRRAFINGKIDLTQAEAVMNIINSKNDTAIKASFRQLNGGIKERINSIKNVLIDILSDIEAQIDYAEEDDILLHIDQINNKIRDIKNLINNYLEGYKNYYGYLMGTLNIVIVGKPNVGKSTLFNFLVGEDRSIVSDISGTTRDYVEKDFYIQNINVSLIDTAGIRDNADPIEQYGINKTIQLIDKGDLIIFVMDLSNNIDYSDKVILELIKDKNKIIVGNKNDLQKLLDFKVDIAISLKNNTNLDKLKNLILNKLNITDNYNNDYELMLQERHAMLLTKIYEILNNLITFNEEEHIDIYSFELQRAIRYISEITGEVYTEDILKNIFDKFCIGK